MNRRLVAAGLSALTIGAGLANSAPRLEPLPAGFYITDLSYDGTVGAGNIVGDGSYETFLWTSQSGPVPLGRASVPTLGVGGGSPDVSYDGDYVSASIADSNYEYLTLGRWSAATGEWEEAFVPKPPFVGNLDQAVGSAWGLSGDGSYVTGYYYLTLPTSYRVQPCSWNPAGTLENLPGTRGRANAASYNGSVTGGWEDSGLGPWFPMIWRSGVAYFVADALGSTQVNSINIDGSVAVGDGPDEFFAMKVATIWRWNGTDYDAQPVGVLDKTVYGLGASRFTSVTDDGSMAVGSNNYSFNPNSGGDAIVWAASTGLLSGTEFIASLGLELPEEFTLRDFQSISPDGSVIAAAGFNSNFGVFQTILIHLREPCPADLSGDRQIDDSDFVSFATAYDLLDCSDPAMPLRCPSDLNRDGLVDDADFVLFASAYDALLCE